MGLGEQETGEGCGREWMGGYDGMFEMGLLYCLLCIFVICYVICFCVYTRQQYIQINISMFNTYTAQKQKQSSHTKHIEHLKTQQWTTKYKTQIRPNLVQRYHRRINGFAKKMQDEPFKVCNEKGRDQMLDLMIKRNYDQTLNITKTKWRFKCKDDWKPDNYSISNSIISKWFNGSKVGSRVGSKGSKGSKGRMKSVGSIEEDSKFVKIKVQYRSRNKQKQINPPMKYSSPILPTLPSPTHNPRSHNKTELLPRRPMLSQSPDLDPEHLQSVSNSIDIDSVSLNNSWIKKPQIKQKTQKQLIEEEQMKALAQNKLYFKSLIDMERCVQTAKERNGLKEILVKCGIYKPVAGKVYKEEEVDRFLEMMKTKQ